MNIHLILIGRSVGGASIELSDIRAEDDGWYECVPMYVPKYSNKVYNSNHHKEQERPKNKKNNKNNENKKHNVNNGKNKKKKMNDEEEEEDFLNVENSWVHLTVNCKPLSYYLLKIRSNFSIISIPFFM